MGHPWRNFHLDQPLPPSTCGRVNFISKSETGEPGGVIVVSGELVSTFCLKGTQTATRNSGSSLGEGGGNQPVHMEAEYTYPDKDEELL